VPSFAGLDIGGGCPRVIQHLPKAPPWATLCRPSEAGLWSWRLRRGRFAVLCCFVHAESETSHQSQELINLAHLPEIN
jgi:hypothetical protein